MAVTLSALSAAGNLTYSTLKQYVLDQLSDRADDKAVRRAGRIVNQSVRRLANRRNWAWLLRRHRIVFRPRTTYTNQVSMSAEANTINLTSGEWLSVVRGYSFYFSGDTYRMRIRQRNSSTQLQTFSADIYVASSDASAANGYLVKDRYEMDLTFKCIANDLHQDDYFGPAGEIPRDQMLHLNQTYQPSSGTPISYVLDVNEITKRWEIMIWQWPGELRAADLYCYYYPAELTNDADVLDWDVQQSAVVYAEINLYILEEMGRWEDYSRAMKAFEHAYKAAVNADRKTLVTRVAGKQPYRLKRMQLNRLFTNA